MSNLIPGYHDAAGRQGAGPHHLPVDARVQAAAAEPDQLLAELSRSSSPASRRRCTARRRLAENDYGYDWLPKLDVTYDVLRAFDLMYQGKMNGYFCQGFNPLMSFPNKKKIIAALSKLKFLVVMDPLATETGELLGEPRRVQRQSIRPSIQTEVFRLPTSCFAEESGSLTNSGRWLQWHWKGAEPPGEAQDRRRDHGQALPQGEGALSADGGAFPEPILNLVWPYADPDEPTTDEIAKEVNGSALEDLPDARTRPSRRSEGGPAARRLRPAARRRQDRLRLLDLLRLLHREGQPDGPARQRRSRRSRAWPRLGLVVAGQSPHPLQSRLLRSRRASHTIRSTS